MYFYQLSISQELEGGGLKKGEQGRLENKKGMILRATVIGIE